MVDELLFIAGISFLLLHEMDAVDKKEWRLLVGLRRLPEEGALKWFVLLHLPLCVALLVLVAADSSTAVRWILIGVDGFMLVHAGLHERLSSRGGQAFANAFSRTLIWSAAGFGAVHIAYVLGKGI